MFLYSVYDVKAMTFGSVTECRTDEEAIRSFLIAIQNAPKNTLLGQFPMDFSLFKIGEFVSDSGVLIQSEPAKVLITGLEVLQMCSTSDEYIEQKNVAAKNDDDVCVCSEEVCEAV